MNRIVYKEVHDLVDFIESYNDLEVIDNINKELFEKAYVNDLFINGISYVKYYVNLEDLREVNIWIKLNKEK